MTICRVDYEAGSVHYWPQGGASVVCRGERGLLMETGRDWEWMRTCGVRQSG